MYIYIYIYNIFVNFMTGPVICGSYAIFAFPWSHCREANGSIDTEEVKVEEVKEVRTKIGGFVTEISKIVIYTGWWLGTFFIFPYIGILGRIIPTYPN